MIRSELDVLLAKVEPPALGAKLRCQIHRLKQRRSFGLVFEQHIPERVRVEQHPIRVGSHVAQAASRQAHAEDIACLTGADTLVTALVGQRSI